MRGAPSSARPQEAPGELCVIPVTSARGICSGPQDSTVSLKTRRKCTIPGKSQIANQNGPKKKKTRTGQSVRSLRKMAGGPHRRKCRGHTPFSASGLCLLRNRHLQCCENCSASQAGAEGPRSVAPACQRPGLLAAAQGAGVACLPIAGLPGCCPGAGVAETMRWDQQREEPREAAPDTGGRTGSVATRGAGNLHWCPRWGRTSQDLFQEICWPGEGPSWGPRPRAGPRLEAEQGGGEAPGKKVLAVGAQLGMDVTRHRARSLLTRREAPLGQFLRDDGSSVQAPHACGTAPGCGAHWVPQTGRKELAWGWCLCHPYTHSPRSNHCPSKGPPHWTLHWGESRLRTAKAQIGQCPAPWAERLGQQGSHPGRAAAI